MLTHTYDYESCMSVSDRVNWKLDDVLDKDQALDFSRPFLPDALAGVAGLSSLSERERLLLNQIRGNSYLYLFAFVEEYIVAMAMRHAQAEMFGDEVQLRAMLRFAEEEVKHQLLFKRFGAAFARGFGTPCEVVGSPEEVAGVILSKTPIAVLLITLHLELVTQKHYVEGVRDNEREVLDPLFVSLLKHHWLEEAQHAKLDVLELDKLAREATPDEIETSVGDFIDILRAFDGILCSQVDHDIRSLEVASGRALTADERNEVRAAQVEAYRRTFIFYGLENATFQARLRELSPGANDRLAPLVRELGGAFSS